MPKRHRKMKKGGFLGFGESSSSDSSSSDSGSSMFGSIGSTLSGWGSSISNGASSAWNKTKSVTTGAYDSVTGTTPSYTSDTSYGSTSSYGGRRKKSKKMRGGFSDNTPTTGIAAHASPISDIKSAQPHNWVGGKTRKRARKGGKHRHSKSCKRH
jgi:hypothetical protein